MDLSVLWGMSYGMYAIGVSDGNRSVGCIVNTVTQITASNPIVALSIHKDNFTCGAIRRAGTFGISILSEETDPKAIARLGFFSARDHDKYDGLRVRRSADGIPLLDEHSAGFLLCDVLSMIDTETHVIFTARVRETYKGEGRPMTYAYYHDVVKGSAPQNAPTFRPAPLAAPASRYVCDVCGYVHEGPLSDEPDDYVCPICGVGKSHFTLQ